MKSDGIDTINGVPVTREAQEERHALSAQVQLLAREALSGENDLFNTLLNAVPVPVFYKDSDGCYLGCNRAFEEFFGAPRESLLGKSVFEIAPRALAEKYHAMDLELLRSSGQQIYECQVRNALGNLRDVVFHKASFADSDGTLRGLVGAILDITERKKVEAALQERELRLRETQLIAGLGTYVMDIAAGTWESSDVLDLIFGIDEHFDRSVAGWRELLHPDDRERMIAYFTDEVVCTRNCFNREYRIIRKSDGQVRWLHGLGQLECDSSGTPLKMIGTVQDITERKAAEEELRQAKDAADAANRAKSRFLTNMRHEIRTPMNSVLVMADLLMNSPLSEEQREQAEVVKKSGNNLLLLIDDILDLSHIEAQSLALEPVCFDLSEMLAQATRALSKEAHTKGLHFSLQIAADVPRKLLGDERRLGQIVGNLVSNAVKFTHEGAVSLDVSCEFNAGSSIELKFRVSDSGIGIEEYDLEEIFRPFNQVDSSDTRRYGGTGLGLALCRKLAELMNGSVGVESRVGKGSSFWCTVQMELQPMVPQPVTNSLHGGSAIGEENAYPAVRHLLLVEDDPQNQKTLQAAIRMFRSAYRVEVASNGREALNMLTENEYDLVLMDCMLPVMNGYDATRAIRDPGSTVKNRQLPIIALTANSMREDRDACLKAGMDDYVSKPLNITQLLAVLDKWLEPQAG